MVYTGIGRCVSKGLLHFFTPYPVPGFDDSGSNPDPDPEKCLDPDTVNLARLFRINYNVPYFFIFYLIGMSLGINCEPVQVHAFFFVP